MKSKPQSSRSRAIAQCGIVGLICLSFIGSVLAKDQPQKLKAGPKWRAPDLVISQLSAKLVSANRVQYSWTVTNVGAGLAQLGGLGSNGRDRVAVQAYLSATTLYNHPGNVPAGGIVIGFSSTDVLAPGASKSGMFTSNFTANIVQLSYLVLKVDSLSVLPEIREDNNTAAVCVARHGASPP